MDVGQVKMSEPLRAFVSSIPEAALVWPRQMKCCGYLTVRKSVASKYLSEEGHRTLAADIPVVRTAALVLSGICSSSTAAAVINEAAGS